jgi:hypothetical protein
MLVFRPERKKAMRCDDRRTSPPMGTTQLAEESPDSRGIDLTGAEVRKKKP